MRRLHGMRDATRASENALGTKEGSVEPTMLWVMVAIAIVAIAGVMWFALSRRRTQELRERFGPEYDHTVRTQGDVKKAEAALEARAKRVKGLQIHPLNAAD